MLLSYYQLLMKFTYEVFDCIPAKDINRVFLDIPKAFGQVCHEGLLLNYGFME